MSSHFFTRWISTLQTIGTGSGILGFRPCWCPSPFPTPSIFRCFSIHSSSPAIEFHSSFFFTIYVSAPSGRPFTYLFRWVSRLGTGSSNRFCGPRGSDFVWTITVRGEDMDECLPIINPRKKFARVFLHLILAIVCGLLTEGEACILEQLIQNYRSWCKTCSLLDWAKMILVIRLDWKRQKLELWFLIATKTCPMVGTHKNKKFFFKNITVFRVSQREKV